MSKRKNIEDFKNDLKRIWGDKIIVSPDSFYVDTHTKICKENSMKILYYTDYKGMIPDLYRELYTC